MKKNTLNRPGPRSLTDAIAQAKQDGQEVHLLSYDIVFEPLKKTDHLPKPVQDQLDDLHDLLFTDPKSAIPPLLQLKKQFPKVPVIYNYLTAAYGRAGEHEATRQLAEENFRLNPQYLFARINYAQFCLMDGRWERIPDIFEGKFDLKLLYPKRTQFHVTEFSGFTGVMCSYFSLIGEKETAKLLYESLLEVAPDSESVRFANVFVKPSLLQRLFQWSLKKSRETAEEKAKLEQVQPSESESNFQA